MAVYFFTFENAETPRVTKLFGHSAPVLDVCWNYDETLMASCDVKVSTQVLKELCHGDFADFWSKLF